jgi:hypothetical protein
MGPRVTAMLAEPDREWTEAQWGEIFFELIDLRLPAERARDHARGAELHRRLEAGEAPLA